MVQSREGMRPSEPAILVFPPFPRREGRRAALPPLGLLALRAYLRAGGRAVGLVDAEGEGLDEDELLRRLLVVAPAFVGFSLCTAQMGAAVRLCRRLREALPSTRLVAGGPHPSALPEETLAEIPELDAVVFGEGEETLAELLDAVDDGEKEFPGVLGLVWRGVDGALRRNGARPHLERLDDLPLPIDGSWERGGRVFPSLAAPGVQVMASRGCPEGCRFCCRAVFGRRHRRRSVRSVLDELELLGERGMREIFFQDDTMNLAPSWVEELCEGILDRGLDETMVFKAAMRADPRLLPPTMLALCRRAGFWMLFFGIETGDEALLRAMGKGLELEGIREALARVAEAGIRRYVSVMVGYVGESRRSVSATIRFLRELDPEFWGVATATPFPGTELRREAEERGLLLPRPWERYDLATPLMGTGELDADEVGEEVRRATLALWRHEESLPTRIARLSRFRTRWDGETARLHAVFAGHVHRLDHVPWNPEDLRPGRLESHVEPASDEALGLGPGWHALEEGDGHRWCDEEALFHLRRAPDGAAVELRWRVDHPRLPRAWTVAELRCNGMLIGRLAGDGRCALRARFPLPPGEELLRFRLSVRPGRLEEGDWDRDRPPRIMGIALISARVVP